uniref:Uncharacterized protein n=1 Tax=Elaeophora elaphi TaxID=1147741 RepID=A0A0R3RIP4_9BILA
MSAPPHHGAPRPARSAPPEKKFSKISKKLAIKKERLVPMGDLPLDAPPINCPPNYEVHRIRIYLLILFSEMLREIFQCHVSMKPLKKHRLSITRRYLGKVTRGLIRLTPEKGSKAIDEAIGSEYTIDLIAVCNSLLHYVAISCDDSKRRLIFKFKKESRDIGPVNKNDYNTFKEMIQKHRNYRQSTCRNKKEDITELITANASRSNESSPVVGRSANLEQDNDVGKLREDFRSNGIVELNEKVTKIINDIKAIAMEMKQMRKELKELTRIVQGGKATTSKEEEEGSESDDSVEKLDVAVPINSPMSIDTMQKYFSIFMQISIKKKKK